MATGRNLVELLRDHIGDYGVGDQLVEVQTPDGKVWDVTGVDTRVVNGRHTNIFLTVAPYPEAPETLTGPTTEP